MAAAIPTQEPDSIVSGDSLVFTKAVSDYSAADGWILAYTFQTPAGANFKTVTAATASDGRSFAISDTANLPAGTYSVQGKVSHAGQVFTVFQGQLKVTPSIAAGAGDVRSTARVILDNIEAVLAKRATREILNSDVAGVKLERIPVEQLLVLKDRYKTIVQNEEAALRLAQGRGSGRNIFMRIRTPGGAQSSPLPWGTSPLGHP